MTKPRMVSQTSFALLMNPDSPKPTSTTSQHGDYTKGVKFMLEHSFFLQAGRGYFSSKTQVKWKLNRSRGLIASLPDNLSCVNRIRVSFEHHHVFAPWQLGSVLVGQAQNQAISGRTSAKRVLLRSLT